MAKCVSMSIVLSRVGEKQTKATTRFGRSVWVGLVSLVFSVEKKSPENFEYSNSDLLDLNPAIFDMPPMPICGQ